MYGVQAPHRTVILDYETRENRILHKNHLVSDALRCFVFRKEKLLGKL
jgi:hypothetical protein